MSGKICLALDLSDLDDALRLAGRCAFTGLLGAVKVGSELFAAAGPRSVRDLARELDLPVVLDLKLHDIPETVGRAIRVHGDLGARFTTVHVQQRAALEAAVRAAEPYGMTTLGVTVLSSMGEEDASDLLLDVDRRVERLARFALDSGLRGLVCSPREVSTLRALDNTAFLLVPGVRTASSISHDHARHGTPRQAVVDGADLIVVGRPIRDAVDPANALIELASELP